jgi:para-nitrobenzyl esterase
MVNGAPATGADTGAVHAGEIVYVFGTLASSPGVIWQPEDQKLSETMGSYWTNFARTGNPNGDGLPTWPQFGPDDGYQVMHLSTVALAAPETHRDRYEFWDSESAKGTP